METAITIVLAVASSSALTAAVTALLTRPAQEAEVEETKADAAATVAAASVALLEPIMAQLELAQRQHLELRAQVEGLRVQVAHLSEGIEALTSQLREHGLEPAWVPTAPV